MILYLLNCQHSLQQSTARQLPWNGFDFERSSASGQWTKIGNVSGNGTTTEPMSYTYVDRNLNSGTHNYRLKQIDFNRNFEYFNLSNRRNSFRIQLVAELSEPVQSFY